MPTHANANNRTSTIPFNCANYSCDSPLENPSLFAFTIATLCAFAILFGSQHYHPPNTSMKNCTYSPNFMIEFLHWILLSYKRTSQV